ncbi:hypothetical protein J4E93_007194 [Alternaria ventricosa]|uniref:uncharacterized protein n=1 Tax=Alternaria ventricosa TaxID=1187951 RepID=UPI0020C56972|nr:uncharacterized protein J4E93_007194 [Alternaria ventricosa]KAI4643125.1 hypothetical protein J4E93_007194 [Alternaria ventricosa]
MNTDADSENTTLAHSRQRAPYYAPTIIDDETCQLQGARLDVFSDIPKNLHSMLDLPLRPAPKRPADALIAREDRNTKRARESQDSDQAEPGDTRMTGSMVDRTLSPEMSMRNRDIFRSAPRSQDRRRRLTAYEPQKSNAEPDPHTASTRKRKAEDIGDRIDFLNFGYDGIEPKTPEERLMKYRADVEISKLHAKRFKVREELYADREKYHFARESQLLAEGRARVAQLLADVEESRLKNRNQANAAVTAEKTGSG